MRSLIRKKPKRVKRKVKKKAKKMAKKKSCWSKRLNGKYIREQHGKTNECYSFATAKKKCVAAKNCHGIATQSNVCGGKYRVSHGAKATLKHYHAWKKYHLWAYTLNSSCQKKHRV